jgi:sugar/nucleoside kinase (ribokinase family)
LVLDVDAVRERKPTAHVGNPLVWSGPPSFAFDPSDIVVAANGDPNWLMETLLRGAPGFLAVDLHVAWMRSRRSSLRYCVEAAHLVSGTVEEFNALAESNVRTRSECVRLVKRGPRGVVVTDKCTARSLPAPDLASPMKSDVGAGDFLLGLLVGSAARSGLIDRSSADHFAAAYQACRGHLSLLLDSADPAEFYQAVARSRRQAVH